MALSNSFDFTLNKNDIIEEAFSRIGYMSEGYSPSSYDYDKASKALNMWLKSIQRDSDFLFNREDAVLFLDTTSRSYDLGSSNDHACLFSDFVETTLGAAEASGQTELTVTSSAGMAASDYIGIELADGTRQWTTIVSVDDATTITVTAALTGTANSAATIYTYTNRLKRPLDIRDVRIRYSEGTNKTERCLTLLDRTGYNGIASKFTTGSLSSYYYDRERTSPGKVYVWPINSNINDLIYFSASRSLDDMDSTTDTLPLPSEWELAVVLNLAAQLAPMYGADMNKTQMLMQLAKYEYERVKYQSNDLTEIQFSNEDY